MSILSFNKFIKIHESSKKDGLRLGQRFVNMYIKDAWPALFYETEDNKAKIMIITWLSMHQYEAVLPPITDSWRKYENKAAGSLPSRPRRSRKN